MANTIIWEGSNIIVRFEGVVTAAEVMEVDNLIYGDHRFDKMDYQIFDYSQVEKMALSKTDTQVIGTLDKTASVWNKCVKVAVISNNDFTADLTTEYKKTLASTSWEVHLFETMEEAVQWCKE